LKATIVALGVLEAIQMQLPVLYEALRIPERERAHTQLCIGGEVGEHEVVVHMGEINTGTCHQLYFCAHKGELKSVHAVSWGFCGGMCHREIPLHTLQMG
jgi:hypothetical protein